MAESYVKVIQLPDIWRTCNKIRSAVYRLGFDLHQFFVKLDPKKRNLVSESRFLAIFGGPLKELIGLTDQEITELADYFRTQDGRILYGQLCSIVHGEDVKRPPVTTISKTARYVCPSERQPPPRGRLTEDELRRLCNLMATIAGRNLVLRPYFQDYELIAKNDGRVTFSHFARILSFVGLILASDDLNLLIKRFIADAYTVDYEEFLKEIENMCKMGMKDTVNFNPQRIVQTKGPIYSSIVPDKITVNNCFTNDGIFHPSLTPAKIPCDDYNVIMNQVKHHIGINRIRVSEFFKPFDHLNSGRIPRSQFEKALDTMGMGNLGELPLTPEEIHTISQQYLDPCDEFQVCWRTFESDVNQVFTIQNLEKYPKLPIEDYIESQKGHGPDVGKVSERTKEVVEGRHFNLRDLFQDFDMHRSGLVTMGQFRQVVKAAGLRLSREEIKELEDSFYDSGDFTYRPFLKQFESREEHLDVQKEFDKQLILAGKKELEPLPHETDIVAILAKIKDKVVRERIRVVYFLERYDPLKQQIIPRADFCRGLTSTGIKLTPYEMETLMNVFASPMRRHFVDYSRFSSVIEESFTQKGLQHSPLLVPVPHLACSASWRNFLNYSERVLLSKAMEKLGKSPDELSNITEVFKDFDKENCGTIPKSRFIKSLKVRDMMDLSVRELDVICKCFAAYRGSEEEVDYRSFNSAVDRLNYASKDTRCQ